MKRTRAVGVVCACSSQRRKASLRSPLRRSSCAPPVTDAEAREAQSAEEERMFRRLSWCWRLAVRRLACLPSLTAGAPVSCRKQPHWYCVPHSDARKAFHFSGYSGHLRLWFLL
ncbi:hypothetical protein AAFF_G00217870 [Aldrovandia affinis]|uniref:Uncharacterized protein n=1 Tax=Aldrovandia affinis TaxID=143900 RepID=A0AAD7SWS1_9TELE|nr:hypothetical protein AAFF_G00217870 [Aldrovandia affinis]